MIDFMSSFYSYPYKVIIHLSSDKQQTKKHKKCMYIMFSKPDSYNTNI